MEKFLTCRAVSHDLKNYGFSEKDCNYLEELSLKCLCRSLSTGSIEIWQLQLLMIELPNILKCNYPIVEEIKNIFKNYLQQLIYQMRVNLNWSEYNRLDYILSLID